MSPSLVILRYTGCLMASARRQPIWAARALGKIKEALWADGLGGSSTPEILRVLLLGEN